MRCLRGAQDAYGETLIVPTEEHDEIVRWLSNPMAYSPLPEKVERVETHISQLFLAGSRVYKLKKPLVFDFLDYRTVADREHACREELRLNRRLAPEMYLDVLPLLRSPEGNYRIGTSSPQPNEVVADWLVVMQRIPTDRTLEALQHRGLLRREHIQLLIDVLLRFYRSLPRQDVTGKQYRDSYLRHVRGNLNELLTVKHHLPTMIVERLHNFQIQFLLLRPQHLDDRIAAGQLVDGHGDLRPEHICFSESLMIFDCIEFNPDFRCIDVADELAFLASECDYLGARWVGPMLLDAIGHLPGGRPPSVLFDFYRSYRMCVRAKIAALRADQLTGAEQARLVSEAHIRLAMADELLEPWLQPLIVVVGGLSGTGKSTLAAAIAQAIGAELLRTDVLRREMRSELRQTENEEVSQIYSRESRLRIYEELFARARAFHAQCISVVLDGTFSEEANIQKAHDLVRHARSIFIAVECRCQPDTARRRIAIRQRDGRDASEATPELHAVQQKSWAIWPMAIPQMTIDTELPVAQQVEQVLLRIAAISS